MSAVDVATKVCIKCGETKPLSQFSRQRQRPGGRQSSCKACESARVLQWKADRRAEMGEEAFLEYQREIVARHRSRTGNASGRRHSTARNAAVAALIVAHRTEFDHLLLLAKRGELPTPSTVEESS